MRSRLKHIAFDLDGTLADTRRQIRASLSNCLVEAGISYDDKTLDEMEILSPKAALSRHGIRSLEGYWRHHQAHCGLITFCDPQTPHILESLLQSGIALSIVTSLPARAAAIIIDRLSLKSFFGLVDTYGSRPQRKPHPAVLRAHLTDLGLVPDEAIYVGDGLGDMKMARLAGLRAIGVSWSSVENKMLRIAGAAHVIDEMAELEDIIRLCPN